MGIELDLVLRRHLFEDRLEMHLAESAHHGLVRLCVVLDAEARILCRDLAQHIGNLLLVLLILRLHRQPEYRSRHVERPRM